MKTYRFHYDLTYEIEAEADQDAIIQLADLIRRDWAYYLDEGNLEVLLESGEWASV